MIFLQWFQNSHTQKKVFINSPQTSWTIAFIVIAWIATEMSNDCCFEDGSQSLLWLVQFVFASQMVGWWQLDIWQPCNNSFSLASGIFIKWHRKMLRTQLGWRYTVTLKKPEIINHKVLTYIISGHHDFTEHGQSQLRISRQKAMAKKKTLR